MSEDNPIPLFNTNHLMIKGVEPAPAPAALEVQMQDAVTRHGHAQFSAADMVRAGEGILATARTAFGTPAVDLTDDTIVDVGGMETTLRNAAMLGLVRKNGNQWEETGRRMADAPAKPAQPAEPPAHAAQAFRDVDAEQALVELGTKLPAPLRDAAVAQMLTRGRVDGQFAEEIGMDPAEFDRKVGMIQAGMEQQAGDMLRARGIDPEHFAATVQAKWPGDFLTARLRHFHSRSPAQAYASLAERYLRTTPPDADAIRAGGLETRKGPNGENLVNIGGQWTTAAAAARVGLL